MTTVRACVRVYVGDSSPELTEANVREEERECDTYARLCIYLLYKLYIIAREEKSCKSEKRVKSRIHREYN